MKASKKDKQESMDFLLNTLGIKPGDEIHVILRRVSRSGMNRKLSLVYICEDGTSVNITYHASRLLETGLAEVNGNYALNVSGGGMDMGFHIVYCLGRVLFPNGFVPADAGKKHGRNNSDANKLDTDGGYALVCHWL